MGSCPCGLLLEPPLLRFTGSVGRVHNPRRGFPPDSSFMAFVSPPYTRFGLLSLDISLVIGVSVPTALDFIRRCRPPWAPHPSVNMIHVLSSARPALFDTTHLVPVLLLIIKVFIVPYNTTHLVYRKYRIQCSVSLFVALVTYGTPFLCYAVVRFSYRGPYVLESNSGRMLVYMKFSRYQCIVPRRLVASLLPKGHEGSSGSIEAVDLTPLDA